MYVTKKHISRRTVLRGAGVTVALPFLSAMVPAATALGKTAAAPKPRMGFFYFPHGAIMNNTRFGSEMNAWTPDKTGADFDFKPILKPFEPFRKYVTVVSNLHNRPAESSSVHAITPGTWLGCVPPRKSQSPLGGTTVDQMAAKHIGQDSTLPSIEVATEIEGGGGQCDGTYGCSFGKTISFATPTTPLPMEDDPQKMFNKLFGRGNTPEERAAIQHDYGSLLDMVSVDANRLKARVGAEDRTVLSDYLDNVREIERRVQKMQRQQTSSIELPHIPVGSLDFDTRLKLMLDMIAVAYQANITRVSTMMFAAEVSGQPFPFLGVPDAFHPLSHQTNLKDACLKLIKIQTYFAENFAKFLKRLSEIKEGESSLLDQAIFLYGSNMSSSQRHDNYPLPSTVIGGGCGKLTGNQHILCAEHTPLANLLLTLLNRGGIEMESVGDSTGQIESL